MISPSFIHTVQAWGNNNFLLECLKVKSAYQINKSFPHLPFASQIIGHIYNSMTSKWKPWTYQYLIAREERRGECIKQQLPWSDRSLIFSKLQSQGPTVNAYHVALFSSYYTYDLLIPLFPGDTRHILALTFLLPIKIFKYLLYCCSLYKNIIFVCLFSIRTQFWRRSCLPSHASSFLNIFIPLKWTQYFFKCSHWRSLCTFIFSH